MNQWINQLINQWYLGVHNNGVVLVDWGDRHWTVLGLQESPGGGQPLLELGHLTLELLQFVKSLLRAWNVLGDFSGHLKQAISLILDRIIFKNEKI